MATTASTSAAVRPHLSQFEWQNSGWGGAGTGTGTGGWIPVGC